MVKKRILIIGSGGREHALGWKIKQSPKVDKIYFAPGNAGTELLGENIAINVTDVKKLVKFAMDYKIDFTIAGPDDALAAGIVNAFKKNKLKIFGASMEAAQIESSKAFAKKLMEEEEIPTAKYKVFKNPIEAKKYIKEAGMPIVIKASGLALGKGVTVARTIEEAEKAIEQAMIKKIFGKSGEEIVIEEFLEGREVSIHAFSDGQNISLFPPSRDHKPVHEGNKGPNTGGMGTIASLVDVSNNDLEIIKNTIVLPTIKGLKRRGIPFSGCLYPGLMMTKDGPKVIEFNSRFGDPETESYMRLLETDLFDILVACEEGRLKDLEIKWSKKFACCIIIASDGYPGSYNKGDEIFGIDKIIDPDVVVFHLGTKKEKGKTITNGGRVLGVTAKGKSLKDALEKAYAAIGPAKVHFEGMQFRKDIGKIL